MELSTVKIEILQALLLQAEPAKAALIAQETGQKTPTVQMHLIDLTRKGYVDSPEKGKYGIAQKGKTALGLPEVSAEKASAILAHLPNDKAFHFYEAISQPLNAYAGSLLEFSAQIDRVSDESVKFHLNRGDFESWIQTVGDAELVKKLALLKETKRPVDELCRRSRSLVKARCSELSASRLKTATVS